MAFRLNRLLNLYEREEEHRRLELQKAENRRAEVALQVESLQKKLADPGSQAQDGEDLHRAWAWRRQLVKQLMERRERLAQEEQAVAEARKALLAARQQRQTLEALKEKYQARVAKEEARVEQVALDEAGLRLHLTAALQTS